jgi:hypothetical protein
VINSSSRGLGSATSQSLNFRGMRTGLFIQDIHTPEREFSDFGGDKTHLDVVQRRSISYRQSGRSRNHCIPVEIHWQGPHVRVVIHMARSKAADGNDESGKTRFSPFLRVLLPSVRWW